MRSDDIDEVFRQATGDRKSVDQALLDRISGTIGSSLGPVRPRPASWVLVSALVVVSVALATTGAVRLGFYGVQQMGALAMGLIFPAVCALIFVAALTSVSEMIPGSRHRMAPWVLLTAGSLALVAIFALLFHDYRTERFVPRGIACLTAGLALAVPVALAAWLILKRGFAVNSLTAGLALGTLAGAAGVTMLELHCPNFQALHVMLWHTAVIPLSAAAVALLLWVVRAANRKPRRRT
jgi:hypothetical protein